MGSPTADDIRQANQQYIDRHAGECDALALEGNGHVRIGKPVDEIPRAARALRCDLIAMATRYRGHSARPKSTSVAEEIVWRSRLPVLRVAEG